MWFNTLLSWIRPCVPTFTEEFVHSRRVVYQASVLNTDASMLCFIFVKTAKSVYTSMVSVLASLTKLLLWHADSIENGSITFKGREMVLAATVEARIAVMVLIARSFCDDFAIKRIFAHGVAFFGQVAVLAPTVVVLLTSTSWYPVCHFLEGVSHAAVELGVTKQLRLLIAFKQVSKDVILGLLSIAILYVDAQRVSEVRFVAKYLLA